ncbi:MAG: hypothetical protein D6800_01645 [Candidatus Zixiibacteriota bacterium]|nr:MAG: hypothetical protein D6800_01645 [candidate division Zixibacteria bacterium]
MSDQQDMRYMGGLKKYLPITYWTFLMATLAISGFPFFAGFFSKDEILWQAFSSPHHGGWIFWAIGFITAGITAFYMFRLLYMTFHGEERMDAETKKHIHESPRSMTFPLTVLGILSVIGGFVGMPRVFGVTNAFEHWLEPVMGHESAAVAGVAENSHGDGLEWGLMIASVVLVLIGWLVARYLYNLKPSVATRLREQFSGLHNLLVNKYFVDEIYAAAVVRPIVYFSLFLWKVFDVAVIDGLVNGAASVIQGVGETLRVTQSGRVRGYATAFAFAVMVLLAFFMGWATHAG